MASERIKLLKVLRTMGFFPERASGDIWRLKIGDRKLCLNIGRVEKMPLKELKKKIKFLLKLGNNQRKT